MSACQSSATRVETNGPSALDQRELGDIRTSSFHTSNRTHRLEGVRLHRRRTMPPRTGAGLPRVEGLRIEAGGGEEVADGVAVLGELLHRQVGQPQLLRQLLQLKLQPLLLTPESWGILQQLHFSDHLFR